MSSKTGWIGKILKMGGGGGAEAMAAQRAAFEHRKERAMGKLLGHPHAYLFNEIVPEETVEVREFEGKVRGTGFGTVGMIEINGDGPLPNEHGMFELVMFTKAKRPEGFEVRFHAGDCTVQDKAYYGLYIKAREIMSQVSVYAREKVIKPGDMIDIMLEREGLMYHVVFDELHFKKRSFEVDGEHHELMLCMLVHQEEMDYGRMYGAEKLMDKLKQERLYPYSDLNREVLV
ncbi:hypothetical protein [Poriferisphaera sp. WC338]|uniref:hypothetical protein n=1 Tax=Poriferisphaera sp. WC338 TaxID=3425129 RepID=UPI003D818362